MPGSAGSSREETRYFTEYRTLQYGSYSTVAACYQNTTDGWRFILPPALYDQYWMDADPFPPGRNQGGHFPAVHRQPE